MSVDIELNRLGKLYQLGDTTPNAGGTLRMIGRRLRGKGADPPGPVGGSNDSHFVWALKDVTLQVHQGEVLGVIGPNGAGKSTLLKILARITEPSEGTARVFGRVGSLLEVGTGFHPELSGRDNIYLNASILGMKRKEIASRFDSIVEFAGVERFIDTPVKHYSSGMYVRLAFSVAAHLEPEILLVDEVLAVGDAAFQQKCLGKISEVASSGRTVLFVSHNMAAMRSLCTRALFVNGGRVSIDGPVERVIEAYLGLSGSADAELAENLPIRRDRSGNARVRVVGFQAHYRDAPGLAPRTGAPADFVVRYASRTGEPVSRLSVSIGVVDSFGTGLFGLMTRSTSVGEFRDAPGAGEAVCRVERLPLTPGKYFVNVYLNEEHGAADKVNRAAAFDVIDAGESGMPAFPLRRFGHVLVNHDWDLKASTAAAEVAPRAFE